MPHIRPLALSFLALLLIGACSPSVTENHTPDANPVSSTVISSLNAGEIDDNARWDQYLDYRNDYLGQSRNVGYGNNAKVRDVDVSARQIITVTDSQGQPLAGARILVFEGQMLVSQSRTYATGSTLFLPNAFPTKGAQSYRVLVDDGQSAFEFNLNPQQGTNWHVKFTSTPQSPVFTNLDVLFLLDSTGSMGDEIAQLQNNILSISSQIDQLGGQADVRYGLVTYRDRGDEYVSQVYDFVPEVTDFQNTLAAVRADGGGDVPESLNEALHNAVQGVQWRGTDTIKLIFLVADAAPHLDYANDYNYTDEMAIASGKGIKIHPIASSGLTPDGEFVFRQLAQHTMGRFVFLTYQGGTSGAPGSERTDLQVGQPGDYSVEQLDELVMKLIKEEVAALNLPTPTNGISPVLKPASLLPPQPIPIPEFTRHPSAPPFQLPMIAGNDLNITIPLPLLMALLLLGLGLFISYSFGQRSVTPKRKRKNDEFEIVED